MTTELPAEAEREIFRIEGIHHFHGVKCLCGFESHRSRSRTEHITGLMRAALTAAAPFIRAQALEDAAMDFPADLPEFADMGADGLIDYISVEDWLNTRAKQERGEG